MQLITLATALTLYLTTASALSAQQQCQAKCDRYKAGTCLAITRFCSARTDLTANSDYTMHSAFSGRNAQNMGTHVFVAPKNHCPYGSDWIPQQYCFSQMFEVCARGDQYWYGAAAYGGENCQQFNIQRM